MFNFLFSAIGRILVWLARQLARLIAWLTLQAVRHPRTTSTAGALAGGVAWLGWQLCATVAGGLFVALSTWKAAHPVTFENTVGTWTRSWWNKWWIYRRTWEKVLTRCDLTIQAKGEVYLPKLKDVRSTPWWDHLTVEMPIGQSPKRYEHEETADALRLGFKAERLVIKRLKPRLLELALMRRDPLLEPVPATAIPASVQAIDWKRIPVGRDEFGQPYTISLLGGHTAAAGSSGAGKASLEWNAMRAIAPAIAAGWVRLVFIDPKLMELAQAKAIVAPSDYAAHEADVLELLQRLVGEMGERLADLGERGERDFEPGPDRPLTLICIDELAPLLSIWKRSTRDKIEDALRALLTQGRAGGFILLGAIQEPTKDVFQVRDLFTRRIALRLPNKSNTEAALIEDATDYGALSHEIPESLPGLLFSIESGARRAVRARFGHVRNEDVEELVAYVENARKVVQLGDWAGTGTDRAENAA
ncbi:FtsK/SpoIIIE domain-containing protein [Streptosporangium sp. NPDC051022]|uniref:FtsK/SpoIIIE domain-containing protein n=1 Tax=Streptosporangium sp. NPDC051022 TaxID=3155752 RepID=UPI003431F440